MGDDQVEEERSSICSFEAQHLLEISLLSLI